MALPEPIVGDSKQADHALELDLVVLGGYFGFGAKASSVTSFVMGVYDRADLVWKTVCTVDEGFEADALQQALTEIDFVKTKKEASNVPSWLLVGDGITTDTAALDAFDVPDVVVFDPTKSPVWRIRSPRFVLSTHSSARNIGLELPCFVVRDVHVFCFSCRDSSCLLNRVSPMLVFPAACDRQDRQHGMHA